MQMINPFLFFLQPCHVVYTDVRPVPLHHYIYPAGADGLHLVVDETVRLIFDNFLLFVFFFFFLKGRFREDNFNTAMATLRDTGDAAKGDKRGRRGGFKGKHFSEIKKKKKQELFYILLAETNVFKIVKMVMERNLAPVIVFSFSKKDCESYACAIAKLDFNSG